MATNSHLPKYVMVTIQKKKRYGRMIQRMIPGMIFIVILICLLNVEYASGQVEEKIIEAVGTADVHRTDVEAAKQEAIANGLVSAVDKALAELLPAEIVSQNFHTVNRVVYDHIDKYISDYKVLTEAVSDKNYRVFIQAKVSMNKLKNGLATSGLMRAKKISYQNIEILVQGTRNLSYFIDFRKELKEIPGVKSIQVSDMQPDEATLLVHFQGSTKELTDALVLKKFGTFNIRVFELSHNKLRIELISM